MSDVATDDDEYYDPPSARCPAPLAAPGPSRFIPRPPSPPPITLGPAFTVLAASQVVAPSQIPPPPHRIDPLISLERPAADAPLELLVLGSGSSGAVPDISCVTSPQSGCEGCLKTLSKNGAKNVRGNTGVVIRVPQTNGEETTIVIDCGKTFREQALKFFPKKALRKIDAVVLTHQHADAIDGLDDLRAWTYKTAVQKTIPVYLNQKTYDSISTSFAYMISKKAASGGGALPTFKWHIMPNEDAWWIQGVLLTPIPVHHGQYFTDPPSPLICLGFLINSSILYLSDVSYIPPETWTVLSQQLALPNPTTSLFPSQPQRTLVPLPRLQALIIDCTGLRASKSHYGLPQALELSHRLGARRTYLTDLSHQTSHECWVHFCREFGKGRVAREGLPGSSAGGPGGFPRDHAEGESVGKREFVYEGFDPRAEDFELFTERALEAVEDWMGGVMPKRWVRPLVDGMSLRWVEGERLDWAEERVWDDEYEEEEEEEED